MLCVVWYHTIWYGTTSFRDHLLLGMGTIPWLYHPPPYCTPSYPAVSGLYFQPYRISFLHPIKHGLTIKRRARAINHSHTTKQVQKQQPRCCSPTQTADRDCSEIAVLRVSFSVLSNAYWPCRTDPFFANYSSLDTTCAASLFTTYSSPWALSCQALPRLSMKLLVSVIADEGWDQASG